MPIVRAGSCIEVNAFRRATAVSDLMANLRYSTVTWPALGLTSWVSQLGAASLFSTLEACRKQRILHDRGALCAVSLCLFGAPYATFLLCRLQHPANYARFTIHKTL